MNISGEHSIIIDRLLGGPAYRLHSITGCCWVSPSGILCLCIELFKDLLCFPRVVLQDLEGFHKGFG